MCCVKLFVSEPPVLVTALLIVWVRLSSDAGTFGGDGWIRTTVLLRTDLQSAAIDLSATSPIGALGWIQTSGFTDLQSVALGHSATSAYCFWYWVRESNPSYIRERPVS